jgi:hypothetical protein
VAKYIFVTFMMLWLVPFVFSGEWSVLRTGHFDCIYMPGYEDRAKECLRVLEVYRDEVVDLTGWDFGRLRVVIEDCGQLFGGFADPLNPNVHLSLCPPSSIWPTENWWRVVGVHEMIHIGQLTKVGGIPRFYTILFGNLFSPNLWVPHWIGEGIAVYGESQLSPYEGMLNDGFFDAVIRVLAKDGKFPTLLDMTYTPFDFSALAGGVYLYGGKFFDYLKEKYGEESFSKFFTHNGSSLLSLSLGGIFPAVGIERATHKVYGKSF